ncbi:corticosteroid-binding globulin-like [Sorex araneus]|uniref:corticosteroid-binding globulin-like n=1 Tax=Sorex araneus TaxID=42254 RepID=UPI002433CB35|nr:corticosteroid-binding globulin-like [Sorex araneus]
MRLASFVSLLCLLLKGFQTIEATDISNYDPYRRLAPYNADFAFRLFKNLATLNPKKDVLISPFSISMTLSMLTLGADKESSSQLFNSLGFDLNEMPEFYIHESFLQISELLRESNSSLKMSMGSTLFHNYSLDIRKVFPEDAQSYYGLENLPYKFLAWIPPSSQINEYLKQKTQRQTSDLFLEIESPEAIILINYIFFSGTWEKAFNPENTELADFFLDDGSIVRVPMMYQSNEFMYLYDSRLKCFVVQLEYIGSAAAFFILPNSKKMDTVIQGLSQDTLKNWGLSVMSSNVDLYIPKLSLSGIYELDKILKALGLEDLKTNHTNPHKNKSTVQKLTKMIFKSDLQLSENGKVAPAKVSSTTEQRVAPALFFNRPFIILVFDHISWNSIFLAKVMNPQNHLAIGGHGAH